MKEMPSFVAKISQVSKIALWRGVCSRLDLLVTSDSKTTISTFTTSFRIKDTDYLCPFSQDPTYHMCLKLELSPLTMRINFWCSLLMVSTILYAEEILLEPCHTWFLSNEKSWLKKMSQRVTQICLPKKLSRKVFWMCALRKQQERKI